MADLLRSRRARRAGVCLALLTLGVVAGTVAAGPAPAPAADGERSLALLADVDGVVGPATAEQVTQVSSLAESRGAELVVLRLDTPGGLGTSMRDVIQEILASPVPVAVFVAPSGARAASAGTFILYASHVAAMAPGTNVGAATPVPVGGGAPAGDGGEDDAEAPMAKATNDAAAYIRSLADLRGRNADWAERAVREAVSLSAREALAEGVIDLVADDVPGLLARSDGRRVEAAGEEVTLATTGMAIERVEPGWRIQALRALSDPNVALILLLLGVFGLVFELSNPGMIGPGVIGAICLLLGLYALNILPVNLVGLALLLVGLGCMTAEAFVPSFGVLGVGGLAAFVAGALLLFDAPGVPGLRVSWPVVAVTGLVSLGTLTLLLRYVWRVQRRPATTGAEALVHRTAVVTDWSDGEGHVHAAGERWRAEGPRGLQPGQEVEVTRVDGLDVRVSPARRRSGSTP